VAGLVHAFLPKTQAKQAMTLRWMLWSWASPSQLLFATIVVGGLLLALGRARVGRALTLAGATGLFLFGVLPTSHYLAAALESRIPQPELPARVAGIILLAGSERPAASQAQGQPQVGRNAGRHLTTQRIARAHPEARIVFSGGPLRMLGKGPLETQPAVAAALFASSGLALERLTFDENSPDTCATPISVKQLVQPQPGETWVVVTSAIHMPRAVACFRAAGWGDVIAQPADYRVTLGSWNADSFQVAKNLQLLDEAAHEWLGLVYYRLTGRTRELFPSAGI
jgi:uncharacterized SAM-binding protein YcdF (DUF218 family)